MLNANLQKDIDIEIENASESVKSFIRDKYFRDTFDLIIKANNLNSVQAEAIELETILFILGLSNYSNIEEAIKKECFIQNIKTVDQVNKDIKDYIFDKLSNVSTVKAEEVFIVKDNQKPLRNIIQDSYGQDILGPKVLDYYEDKRSGVIPVKDIELATITDVSKDIKLNQKDISINTEVSNKDKIEKDYVNKTLPKIETRIINNQDMHDVYRELPENEDKVIKREIEIDLGKDNEDDIIKSS